MNLARYSVSATEPVIIYDIRFDPERQIFAITTPAGFAIYRTCPLQLLRKRELRGGTLASVIPSHSSSLLFLLGGGRSPLYPANKLILWDDAIGAEVAELEFRERIRGVACRRGWVAVALRWRVVLFEIGESVSRKGEWDTCDNPRGLLALATDANTTLLAIPGRQMGHVQLIHLPPCPPSPSSPRSAPPRAAKPLSKHPVSIIAAHESALTTLTVTPSGKLLATTSSRGTLVRTWDAYTGKLVRELRRGSDKADIYGVSFRPDEAEMCVWSDKGTVHVFSLLTSGSSNRQSTLSNLAPYLRLPKYFDSQWSYAQYRIPVQNSHISLSTSMQPSPADRPEEERCVVTWIHSPSNTESPIEEQAEPQFIALTYTGGWYRLSVPSTSSSPGSPRPSEVSPPGSPTKSARVRTTSLISLASATESTKGKERERDGERKEGRSCILQEYRKFGRWDGWG
ncbi:hypothetical protein CONPUDRAFT_123308 [Coniophora puteana RWD-64-598 SS2]|uniref:Uncharacterized protein n=1 Tax=Coniophora puteana (strain RWD-64-598) TaxID=741705 RepID=A0A5M3MTC1_CONPW|nr:uncharacterized protein CONPUDRAFT_123308 [Coniophora puteana RWD-64-598 SS2]EIW82412.1 hypothetical protein CONPUDRAFT_123308 [Coniophora puteana RWD-64-598 SS2]